MAKTEAIQRVKIFLVREKRLFAVAAVALGISVLLFAVLGSALFWFQQRQAAQQVEVVNTALSQETSRLLEAAKEMDERRVFDAYIQERDILNLISLATDERTKRGIGGILVADKNGIVLTRTRVVSQRGDYIFHTTAWGRELAQGKEVATVEKGGAWPLIVTGAVPLVREGSVAGAIVAAHLVDNEYASRFAERHLPAGVKLAFYSREEGIVGNNFHDEQTERILSSYFNTGSNWIQNGRTGETFNIAGQQYFVSNLAFPGIETSPGGVLVFSPFRAFWQKSLIKLSEPRFTIYNSTMRLEPSSGILDREFEHRVAIEILTGGEPINAAEATLLYDPAKIRVADIITTRSFCSEDTFLEKSIDNESGRVRVACVAPGSGFSNGVAIAAELLIQPLAEGRFELLFGEDTKVLAHDGLGTNVLRQATDGSYQVAVQPRPGEEHIPQLLVFSPSHPNPARWYNKNAVRFTWLAKEGHGYRYEFGEPGQEPLEAGEIAGANELRFTVEKDGIYELKIASTVYPVKIDTTPPSAPTIRASASAVRAGEVIRFEFEAADALSGLQPTFYLRQDGSLLLPVGKRFDTAFQKPGIYTITVRVFDNAGNFSDSTQEIIVRK